MKPTGSIPSHTTPSRGTRALAARRGFTLWEMLLTVVVVAAAMNVATRLVHLTIRSSGQTADASRTLASQRQWLNLLRHDAWSARSRTMAGGTLSLGGGQSIVWRQEADQLVRDGPDGEARSWPIEGRRLQWAVGVSGVLELSDGEATIALATPAIESAGEP